MLANKMGDGMEGRTRKGFGGQCFTATNVKFKKNGKSPMGLLQFFGKMPFISPFICPSSQSQRPQTWQLPELPAVTSFKLLDSLLIVESCLKRIWFSDSKLPTGYQFRHQHMGQLLADPNNLLAMAKQFSVSRPRFHIPEKHNPKPFT
jgi:hypothetical protein